MKKSAQLGVALAIFFFLLMFVRSRKQQYVDPSNPYYQVVDINGSPFLQKAPDSYGYGPQAGPYAPSRHPDGRNYY